MRLVRRGLPADQLQPRPNAANRCSPHDLDAAKDLHLRHVKDRPQTCGATPKCCRVGRHL
jgi:hypothetical protein